jgi:TonB family protein
LVTRQLSRQPLGSTKERIAYMNLKRFISISFLICLLSSCSSRQIIITEDVAYYPDDDSLLVLSELNHHNTSNNVNMEIFYDTADIAPVPIEREQPDYRIDGNVFVIVWVTKEGKIKCAKVIKSSDNSLNQYCLWAAMQWKFTPAVLKGKLVNSRATIPFRFRHKSY